MELVADRLLLEDNPVLVSEHFYENGWTDGLPIVPPTPARVEEFLSAWAALPEESLGPFPPSFQDATLERIAICAVMAGCSTEHLAAVVGAVNAMLDPAFNLNAIQCTTSATTPALVFNGPIRDRLSMNYGSNAFGPGTRSNAVIGRAIRLIMLNIGSAIPGKMDKASLGFPGKFTFCFAENEDANPWEPYHVEQGYAASDSVVTAFGATGSVEARDGSSKSPEGMMQTFARTMTTAAFVGANNVADGGQAVLVLVPEHAHFIANAGYSKVDVKNWLWERAYLTLDDFSEEYRANISRWQKANDLHEDGIVRITKSPNDISIIVCGGPGAKSAFIPTWGGLTRSASATVPESL